MTAPVKTIGLTALILLLAGCLWLSINSWRNIKQPAFVPVVPTPEIQENMDSGFNSVSSTVDLKHQILISMDLSSPLPNPFVLSGVLLQLEMADWTLEDSVGTRLAEGRVWQTDGIWNEVTWYEKVPQTEKGYLKFYSALDSVEPIVAYEVRLLTQTQTVELFFRKQASDMDCGEVFAVKRDLVSTSGHKLNYYETALRELVKGPTPEEADQGWISAIPLEVQVVRVGVDEKNRIVGDFSESLFNPPMDDCRKQAILAQIEQTLATVPVSGKRVSGRVYVQGQAVNF